MVKVEQESRKLMTKVEDETAEVKDEQNVTNNTFVLPKRVNFDDEENEYLNPLVEFDFLVAWNDTYVNDVIFEQIPNNVEFISLTLLKRNDQVKLIQQALYHDFHLIERIVVVNESNESRALPWKSFYLFRRGKKVKSNVDYPKYHWNVSTTIKHQQNNDVIFASDSSDSLNKMFSHLQTLLPNSKGTIVNTDDMNLSLKPLSIPVNHVADQQVEIKDVNKKSLDSPFKKFLINSTSGLANIKKHMSVTEKDLNDLKNNKNISPCISFASNDSNEYDFIPKEEVGYGENVVKSPEEQKSFRERDKKEICDIIRKKMRNIKERFKDDPHVTLKQIEKLEVMFLLHWEAFWHQKFSDTNKSFKSNKSSFEV